MNSLEEIRDEMIIKSFPELIREDIQIEYLSLADALLQHGGFTEEGFYIEVDYSLKNCPKTIIQGGMAHELSHVLTDYNRNIGASLIDRILYKCIKNYKTMDERNTDLQVVIRGYGKELLDFLEYSEKEGYPHYKEDGLSIRELKQILNQ